MLEFSKFILLVAGSSALTGGLAFVFKNTISKLLTSSLKHSFDKKLEVLKDRLSDESQQREALRDIVISGYSNRKSVLFNKKVESAEKILKKLEGLTPALTTVGAIGLLPKSYLIDPMQNSEAFEYIKSFTDKVTMESFSLNDIQSVRLYLPEICWTYFSAYQQVLVGFHAIALQLNSPNTGLPQTMWAVNSKVLKTAMPDYKVNDVEIEGELLVKMVNGLKEMVIISLQSALNGDLDDAEAISKVQALNEAIVQANQETMTNQGSMKNFT
ncbi:hypothetical protein [Grimontia marina]|uniref:Uncharacterized protein n=1 Tax=Grimontia marina TaxID=646534 RepID=A0A128F8P2_9GAMM|nr:hypothetical protein [Grimontia marina]CZF83142.1 hypothetical protein GMA8713_02497 [Grimontia marina]